MQEQQSKESAHLDEWRSEQAQEARVFLSFNAPGLLMLQGSLVLPLTPWFH